MIMQRQVVMQRHVVMIDLPKYKEKVDRFGADLAIKGCMVNNVEFDPGNNFISINLIMCFCFKIITRWWGLFGGSTSHLKRIAMRILSLTSSSSGCERNWSTFEAKRNRLETNRLNNLVYVQFNANLMGKKNKKRKDRTLEVILANNPLTPVNRRATVERFLQPW
uniref:HAT C-terminal dimerisation domain-containing protein n=1 Tax=Lactuca sativa TaxID=4236 RepID=A0A9R1VI71_LACSA|nr:hypothetical protein LSAT_V11C500260900 [Lactuca sativa]